MRIPHKGGIFIEKVIKSKAAEASFSSCCCHPPKPSVTRWQYIFQYLAIYNNEQVPNSIKIAKLGSKCCQGLLNKPFKNCQRRYFCCHSGGEILPNLVTLVTHPHETFWNPISPLAVASSTFIILFLCLFNYFVLR